MHSAKVSGSTASGDVQNGQALGFGLGFVDDEGEQAGHVIHVDELDLVFEVALTVGKHAGQALALSPHPGGPLSATVGGAAKGSHQVVLHAGSGKNMGTEQVHAATAERRGALLHHAVGFHLVDGVGKSMSCEGRVFCDGCWQIRTVGGNATGEKKLLHDGVGAIGLGDGFHHSRRAGDVDLPHAIEVKHAAA